MFLFWSIILLCIIDLFVVWGNVTYELVCLSILKQARVGGGGGGIYFKGIYILIFYIVKDQFSQQN